MTMLDPDMALLYLDFVQERHRIWELRQAGMPQGARWTLDPILASRKFTNVFRLLDPGSQFFITDLGTEDISPRDVLARAVFYRLTNLPYPLAADLNEKTADVLCFLRDEGMQVFSGAYMIAGSLGAKLGMDKSREAVLTSRRVVEGAWGDFSAATTQQDRFLALKRHSGMGNFMSMQILTDVGYTTEFREDEFVICGPGAAKGAGLLFPGLPSFHALNWARSQDLHAMLGSRNPSLMDVQNTFCEFFKYERATHQPVSPKPYRPAHPGAQPAPALPRKW
jgi:hypothetical protein